MSVEPIQKYQQCQITDKVIVLKNHSTPAIIYTSNRVVWVRLPSADLPFALGREAGIPCFTCLNLQSLLGFCSGAEGRKAAGFSSQAKWSFPHTARKPPAQGCLHISGKKCRVCRGKTVSVPKVFNKCFLLGEKPQKQFHSIVILKCSECVCGRRRWGGSQESNVICSKTAGHL